MQKAIVIIFALIVIAYVVTNQKKIGKRDVSLLVVSVIALVWKYYTHKSIIEASLENFEDSPQSLLEVLSTLKPIDEEEIYTPISKNLLMYYTTFNSLSHTYNTKVWRNIVDTTKSKSGELQCNTSMYFDLLPSFSKVAGFTLGPNKLTGPYSNTLGVTFRNQYTLMLAFKHGNLINDGTQKNKIELLKLWANSPNNNALSLFIEPGSLNSVNNTQFGNLLFQYADYSPVTCKISKNDDMLPIENNVLCFIFIVKEEDKLRVLYMTEKSTNIITLAEFNIGNTEVTFSNKELFINRFNNWNANIYNFAIYKTALSDTYISSIYQHIKSLYAKTNDPSYQPIVDKYNETLTKLSQYVSCPFDQKTCTSCEGVKEWNDITQVMNAPLKCRKAISAYCKKNTSHSFCQCWNEKSEIYKNTGCKMIRSMFETDNAACLTNVEMAKLTAECNKKSQYIGLNYDGGYTFDKVRVKYDDSLTSQERSQIGKTIEKPDFMTAGDYQANLAADGLRLNDNKKPKKAAANTSSDTEKKDVQALTEDELLMKQIMETDEDIKLSKKSDTGLWSMLKIFG